MFAEYHASGSRNAGFVYREGRFKLIYHVDMPNQLFDLDGDPLEEHDLLADAIRSVTDNPLFLESFFTNQIVPNVEPAMQRRLQSALKVAKEAHGQGTLAG